MGERTILWADLSADEQVVLANIANTDEFEWHGYTFKGLARITARSIEQVREACRSLRAKGLARHVSGMMTEDGDFVGSGYTASPEGSHLYWNAETNASQPKASPHV